MFPDKKIIVHFLPPHYPFVRKPISRGGIGPDLPERKDSAWELAEKGKIDHRAVEEAYRDNIAYIDSYIGEIAEKLEGKTMLTSDHGNFVGEAGIYGHPKYRKERPLKEVPYHEL